MGVALTVYDLAPHDLGALAAAAESVGVEAIWLGEHIVLPVGYGSSHPSADHQDRKPLDGRPIVAADTELIDPWVGLGFAAGRTSTISLATGIYLLALRHPLGTARAVASLHEASGGRFAFGVGVGWLREEFDALDVEFASRGRQFREAMAVVRRALDGGPVSFDGEFYRFDSTQVVAKPIDVPWVLGGNTDLAIERAVREADGWLSSGIPTFDEAVDLRRRIEEAQRRLGRDDQLELHFRVPGSDPETVDRYLDAGFEHLVFVLDELGGRSAGVDVLSERLGVLCERARSLPRETAMSKTTTESSARKGKP